MHMLRFKTQYYFPADVYNSQFITIYITLIYYHVFHCWGQLAKRGKTDAKLVYLCVYCAMCMCACCAVLPHSADGSSIHAVWSKGEVISISKADSKILKTVVTVILQPNTSRQNFRAKRRPRLSTRMKLKDKKQ